MSIKYKDDGFNDNSGVPTLERWKQALKGSGLEKEAEQLYYGIIKEGINPGFLYGLGVGESSHTIKRFKHGNNPWNYGYYEGMSFPSLLAAAQALSRNLYKGHYKDKYTLEEIMYTYSPPWKKDSKGNYLRDANGNLVEENDTEQHIQNILNAANNKLGANARNIFIDPNKPMQNSYTPESEAKIRMNASLPVYARNWGSINRQLNINVPENKKNTTYIPRQQVITENRKNTIIQNIQPTTSQYSYTIPNSDIRIKGGEEEFSHPGGAYYSGENLPTVQPTNTLSGLINASQKGIKLRDFYRLMNSEESTPEYWKSIGVSSGDPNLIHPGEKIDLSNIKNKIYPQLAKK